MAETERSGLFPIFLDLRGRKVVFIGGGRIATRRLLAMDSFADGIQVIAPEVSEEIARLAEVGRIVWLQESFNVDDPTLLSSLDDAALVLACTDDHQLNDSVFDYCRSKSILVNICSDHTKCDFHFPGVVRHGDFTVGVNASGRAHGKARELRERIQEMLEDWDG